MVYEPGGGSFLGTESASALDFPGSRAVGSKCLLFKLSRLWYFCYNKTIGHEATSTHMQYLKG